jgi:hypothetical protein
MAGGYHDSSLGYITMEVLKKSKITRFCQTKKASTKRSLYITAVLRKPRTDSHIEPQFSKKSRNMSKF